MTHYAMATGVMALTKWGTGTVSSWLWSGVNHSYNSFFGWVLVFSIPPVILAFLAPFPQKATDDDEGSPLLATGPRAAVSDARRRCLRLPTRIPDGREPGRSLRPCRVAPPTGGASRACPSVSGT